MCRVLLDFSRSHRDLAAPCPTLTCRSHSCCSESPQCPQQNILADCHLLSVAEFSGSGAAAAAITKYLYGWVNKSLQTLLPELLLLLRLTAMTCCASASLLYTAKIVGLELDQAKVTQTGHLWKNEG